MKSIWARLVLLLLAFAAVLTGLKLFEHPTGDVEQQIGRILPPWMIVPFVLMLLSIAVVPLTASHWWDSNRNKGIVAAIWGLPVLLYFLFAVDSGPSALLHLAHEYYSFILLLAALFTVCGGIYLQGDLRATPWTNTIFLATGGVIASFIGTTGASMLLIRPMLRTNSERHRVTHIYIFFIFIVANCGGLLTPLGDPPLFLGFLRGVPFGWTLYLWKEWLLLLAILLVVFFSWDSIAYRRETLRDRIEDVRRKEPLRILGSHHFLLLAGVIGAILFLSGSYHWFREPALVGMAVLSYLLDHSHQRRAGENGLPSPRQLNRFTFHAIAEVAVLFAGIFVTMLPAICILKARGGDLGVDQPWQFFWLSGGLSSFLDNAPTYLTYFSLAQGLAIDRQLCTAGEGVLGACVATTGVPELLLIAMSCGSVFMGANTYIGNAPNFMVKSIVEEARVKMPSFFGYMGYSVGILIPIFLLFTWIFF